MPPDDIVFRRESDALVATPLLRRITGSPSEDSLWRMLDAAVGPAPAGDVILDCVHMQYCSSPGIGLLVAIATRCRRSGARFLVRNACPSLAEVIRVIRLDAILEPDRAADVGRGGAECR